MMMMVVTTMIVKETTELLLSGRLGAGSWEQNSLQLGDEVRANLAGESVEIGLPPSDRRKIARSGHVQERPIGFAAFEGDKKVTMRLGHLPDDGRDQVFSCVMEVFHGNRGGRHPIESRQKLLIK